MEGATTSQNFTWVIRGPGLVGQYFANTALSGTAVLTRSEAVDTAGSVQAWRLYGALFFGAVKLIESIEDQLDGRAVVIDLKNVIYIDSSGADALENLLRTCRKRQVRLVVCGLMHQPLDIARRSGWLERLQAGSHTHLADDLAQGLALAQRLGPGPGG